MAILQIRIYPDPALRAKCAPVTRFDAALSKLAADLVETMHSAPGIGLAAAQVGFSARVVVVDLSVGQDPAQLFVLVNPEVVRRSGLETDVEGCLSLPGLTDKVDRPLSVLVQARSTGGETFEIPAEGWLARALSHEIDHLDGILFTDHLRGLRRERMARQLRKLAAERQEVHA